MGWFSKKQEPEAPHVETVAEYWAKRDAERDAREAEAARLAKLAADDDDNVWIGYPEPKPTQREIDEGLFNYELSAYSDKVGYYSDGIERVCPLPRRK